MPKIEERGWSWAGLYSRADHEHGHQGGQSHQGQQGGQNPPPYSQHPPPNRPDSPRPAPQYHGKTKVSDSSKNKKMPKIEERSLLKALMYARADNEHAHHGGQAHEGQQGGQNPPPYSQHPPPNRPDTPPPAPQYHGKTKVADSSKNKKMPPIKERSFDFDWVMDLD